MKTKKKGKKKAAKAETTFRKVFHLLVREEVSIRTPLGTTDEMRRELDVYSDNFYREHQELVDAAFKKESERSEALGVTFKLDKFMDNDIVPEILRTMPKWLSKYPWPIYGGQVLADENGRLLK